MKKKKPKKKQKSVKKETQQEKLEMKKAVDYYMEKMKHEQKN